MVLPELPMILWPYSLDPLWMSKPLLGAKKPPMPWWKVWLVKIWSWLADLLAVSFEKLPYIPLISNDLYEL